MTEKYLMVRLIVGRITILLASCTFLIGCGAALAPEVFVDTAPPAVLISERPKSIESVSWGVFTFSGTDNSKTLTFTCSLDSAPFIPCESPLNLIGLTEGPHTFNVQATDNSGNVSNIAAHSWTVDSTSPAVTVSSTPPSLTKLTSATFAFSASDSGTGVASYSCSLDGGAFTSCTSPVTLTGLDANTHTFIAKATDSAGNSAVQSAAWTIDRSAPLVTLTSQPSNPTNSTSATFTFSATDTGGGAVATIECQVDGGAFAICLSPFNLSGLSSGNHTFNIRATDTATNVSAVESYGWSVSLSSLIAYDYLATSMAELTTILANSDTTLSGKTIALQGSFGQIKVQNRRFTNYLRFASADTNNKATVTSVFIANSDYIEIDNLNIFHTLWPATPNTGFGRELIFMTGSGHHIRIKNNHIKHGYGNTAWSGWPAGATGMIPYDTSANSYPELLYKTDNSRAATDVATRVNIQTDIVWASPTIRQLIRIFNNGTAGIYYAFGDATVTATTASTRIAPGSFGVVSLTGGTPPTHISLLTAATETSTANCRTETGIYNWMANGIGRDGGAGFDYLDIIDNTWEDLSNAIKLAPAARGHIRVIGNRMDRIYQDYMAFGGGKTPPNSVEIAWNTGSRPFSVPGITSPTGHPGDPHGDFIQLYGNDFGANLTLTDWTNLRIYGNLFYSGQSVGQPQGFFADDMPTELGRNYKNIYVTGNLMLSKNAGRAISLWAENAYIFGNTAVRQDPSSPENIGAGASSASIIATNGDVNSFFYVDSNVAEAMSSSSDTDKSNNVLLGQGGSIIPYSDVFVGPTNSNLNSVSEALASFTPKAGSVLITNKIGALGWGYVDYANRTIDKTKEKPAWSFKEVLSTPPNQILVTPFSAFMGGVDNQVITVPANVEIQVSADDSGTLILQNWVEISATISPFQYFRLRTTTPVAAPLTTVVPVTITGVTKNFNYTTASTPFTMVNFNADYLKTTTGLLNAASISPTKYVFAFRISLSPTYTSGDFLLHSSKVVLRTGAAGELRVGIGTSTQIEARFAGALPTNGTPATIIVSVDTTAATTAEGIKIYRDSTPVALTSSAAWTQNLALNIGDATVTTWSLMSTTAGASLLEADVGFFYMAAGNAALDSATGTVLDISSAAVRNRFKFDLLGSTGSGGTGSLPQVFITGDAAVWNAGSNSGSGKSLTITGAVE